LKIEILKFKKKKKLQITNYYQDMSTPTVPTVGSDTINLAWKEQDITFREVGSALQLRWSKWTQSADVLLYVIDIGHNNTETTSSSISTALIDLMEVLRSFYPPPPPQTDQSPPGQLLSAHNVIGSDEKRRVDGGSGGGSGEKLAAEDRGVVVDEQRESQKLDQAYVRRPPPPKIFIVFNKFDREEGGIGFQNVNMTALFRQVLQRYHFDHLFQQYQEVETICVSARTGFNIGCRGGLLDQII
jgi:hypothetical protein